ncbi:MAG TPA: hypothetical protein VFQ24_06550 [Terriglobia bacterium]|nr:hypothetical protein [Terriglobia bacterium]
MTLQGPEEVDIGAVFGGEPEQVWKTPAAVCVQTSRRYSAVESRDGRLKVGRSRKVHSLNYAV